MSGPQAEPPLPLYRSTDTVRAAQIVGVGDGIVQVDFQRYGDDVPIIKNFSRGTPTPGDFLVELHSGNECMGRDEFHRKYRPASNDAPREPLNMLQAWAKVALEAASVRQSGKRTTWAETSEAARLAAVAVVKALQDSPNMPDADIHNVWREAFAKNGGTGVDVSATWDQLSADRKASQHVFCSVIASLRG